MPRRLATADIGSNTVHMLIADVGPRTVARVLNDNTWLSLGEIVSHHGYIPKDSEQKLIETLRSFKNTAASAHAEAFYVFATEAMRKADNHEAVMQRIRSEVGIEVDLIAPAREAALTLRGALLDCSGLEPVLLIEIGGGSVQVAWTEGGQIGVEASLPLGTGVLMDQAGLTQPATPEQLARLHEIIAFGLERLGEFPRARRVIASGGVARGVWRALHPDGDRRIRTEELDYLRWASERLTVDQLVGRFDVKPKRAATLLPGVAVFRSLLERFGHAEMLVSEYGVREGALLELQQGGLPVSLA